MDDCGQMEIFAGATTPRERIDSACRWLSDVEHHRAFMMRPQLASKIFPNESDVDHYADKLEQIYHQQVSPHTTFPCHTWREAKQAVRR